ncbi:guanine deaminase [Bradyrhizobium sp. U87765 SZCCT0131]|uniref:guanine deaminase n=1 Tax=unclassified Bradyrhizobium TaxID=2631580 RepID=UPI001BABF4A0|nr:MULTISPECIES: guanine deaminase [unclassified Bradyrhizobium]MBR1221723.1 guanine deaminase [Bradyrhizobium sp. U87765 SZCCT0131]MBR1264354.1 guanine deaminase [Bradyrhizobium sp. U87765 SZCCT0134]MBR1304739.1 guanine deaminase [Bradyrhizobium sp. U87765 SZCCT0110]MBR1322404.1 guanine deaminase [Bradyrhizobium sp. U87765 SZCCT0109]MBR1346668.1 guanine deaminase [Bradyrhizobium sp. U87765 SZCCT0048]
MTDTFPFAVERALRGRVLSFQADPRLVGGAASHRYWEDGLVLVAGGRIVAVSEAAALLRRLPPDVAIDDHRGRLILPGFIDTHIHYPQTRVIASYGAQLLEWLQKYTFVEEQKLRQQGHAEYVARFFFDELLRQGTTTAVVYCSVHPQSVEAFFAESERRGTRMIAGKVMMDRNAPEALTDTAASGYEESRGLLQKWHGRGRQLYAITPRFAITSTPEQLEASGALVHEFPDAYVQTHLGENLAEIALVKELFPAAKTYTGVYERYGLLGPRSIFGHCIYLEDSEVAALADSGSIAAFCPTSNLFLGSGLFDMRRLHQHGVRVGVATDVGGGTSYSMLQTANEAYKVLQMQGQSWPALQAFYMMTRGNAAVLGLDDRIGRLEEGFEADIIVLDARATPAMAHRMECIDGDLAEELFLLMTLGDDRCVAETYVAGRPVKPKAV